MIESNDLAAWILSIMLLTFIFGAAGYLIYLENKANKEANNV